MPELWLSHDAGLTEGLKVASERLSWGFSRGAKALAGNRHATDSLTAKAKRALRAAPQVDAHPRLSRCHARAGTPHQDVGRLPTRL